MGVNPVLWLACRERWQVFSLWMLTILLMSGVAVLFAVDDASQGWLAWSFLGGALTLILYLGMASQAGRFFVEAQRSGLIELLLASPLTVPQIVQGQWRALLRLFGLPLALCLAAQFVGTYMNQRMTWQLAAGKSAPVMTVTITNGMSVTTTTRTGTVTVVTSTASAGVPVTTLSVPNRAVMVVSSAAGSITVLANLAALVWFGMWMGLNSKNANLATLKTIACVQIIPWFAVSFVAGMAAALFFMSSLGRAALGGVPSGGMIWYPLIVSGITTLLYLAKDIGFILWARKKLYCEFRERAARAIASIRPPLPPPLPQAGLPALPPVIPAK